MGEASQSQNRNRPDPVRTVGAEPVNAGAPEQAGSAPRSIADAIAACGLPESTGAAFAEPWQAQLFAMTLALNEAGHVDWPEWTAYLSRAIRVAQDSGDADLGNTYWSHWLEAFEQLLRDKALAAPLELGTRREALRAYSRVARSASLLRGDAASAGAQRG